MIFILLTSSSMSKKKRLRSTGYFDFPPKIKWLELIKFISEKTCMYSAFK